MTGPASICQTPGTIFSHGWRSGRIDGRGNILHMELTFPFDAQHWLDGTSQLREPTKSQLARGLSEEEGRRLFLYDRQAQEKKRIGDLIHDQLETVGADCYRVMRELDASLGVTTTEDSIRWAAMSRAERQMARRT